MLGPSAGTSRDQIEDPGTTPRIVLSTMDLRGRAQTRSELSAKLKDMLRLENLQI